MEKIKDIVLFLVVGVIFLGLIFSALVSSDPRSRFIGQCFLLAFLYIGILRNKLHGWELAGTSMFLAVLTVLVVRFLVPALR